MIHPLLHLIGTKPHLLGEHAEAYAELVGTEIDKTKRNWTSRFGLYAVALFLLTVGTVFTGMALMLWALVPLATMHLPWLLVVVPLVPLMIGGYCVFRARAEPKYPLFDALKQQLSADLAMLREVNAQ